jgi:hypothetical protein
VITDPDVVCPPFDLITAFRFFLNADVSLRHEALDALHRLLSEHGVLVLNVHGNTYSMRFPAAAFRRHLLRQRHVNQLSYPRVRRLLGQHGFRVQEVRGFGLMIARVYKLLGPRRTAGMERLVQRFPRLGYICVDVVIVAYPT